MTNIFGGSGITSDVYHYILSAIPRGKVILELGSGDVSTRYLSDHYVLHSVEDNAAWVGKHRSHYIHAPLVNGWYDVQIVKREIPARYDLILVDGPTGEGNRIGFLHNLRLFNTHVPLIFDDTDRRGEADLVRYVARVLNAPVQRFKTFSVINAPM